MPRTRRTHFELKRTTKTAIMPSRKEKYPLHWMTWDDYRPQYKYFAGAAKGAIAHRWWL